LLLHAHLIKFTKLFWFLFSKKNTSFL